MAEAERIPRDEAEATSAPKAEPGVPTAGWGRIEGKVAQVVNERELVINRGRQHRVRTGMKFAILAEQPLEVRDPDTGEVIERLPRDKARVQVIRVYDRAALCKTYETRIVGGGLAVFAGINDLYGPEREVAVRLRVEDSSFPPPLANEERIVRPGDRAIQLYDEEVEP